MISILRKSYVFFLIIALTLSGVSFSMYKLTRASNASYSSLFDDQIAQISIEGIQDDGEKSLIKIRLTNHISISISYSIQLFALSSEIRLLETRNIEIDNGNYDIYFEIDSADLASIQIFEVNCNVMNGYIMLHGGMENPFYVEPIEDEPSLDYIDEGPSEESAEDSIEDSVEDSFESSTNENEE